MIAPRVALSYPQRVSRLVLIGAAIMGANNETMLVLGEEVRALEELGEINAPMLIVWGEQDAFFPREEQEWLATTIPDATLEVYPQSDHAVHWERPKKVVRDLEAFMKDTHSA